MITINDLASGMKHIVESYGHRPVEVASVTISLGHTAEVELRNGDKWRIGYAGQAVIIWGGL